MNYVNPKLKIALKQYKTKLKEKSISYEQLYRAHILYELSKIRTKSKEKVNICELQKKFPSECLMHPVKPHTKMEPREKMFAEQVDALFKDNEMFKEEKRNELLRVYHHISSSYHIFSDFVESNNLDFHEFTENAENLIRINNNFQNRIMELLLTDQPEIETPSIKPDATPEIVKTDEIQEIETEQYKSLKQRLRMNHLNSLKGMIEDDSSSSTTAIEAAISGTTSRGMKSRCLTSQDIVVEKDQVIAKLESRSKVELDDLSTMRSELQTLEQKKRVLLDRRNKAQSAINLSKRKSQTSSRSIHCKADTFSPQTSKINTFTGIAARNETKLAQILAENQELSRQIEQIQMKRKSDAMFTK